ncbi:hypothetical protein GE09DRAFT_1115639 [Coniochaeta sp. 2T2.1]|nr:hypothetical protein GE09DRAFT_1115639 [Coniochaeta sp. 2T2.1]
MQVSNLVHDEDTSSPPPPPSITTGVTAPIASLIPSHPACKEALSVAHASLPPSIFNHSLRVFLYASALSHNSSPSNSLEELSPIAAMPIKPPVLFVACIFHDLGTSVAYDAEGERFEVSGGDAAVRLLRRYGEDEASIREAWLAVALHTSGGIAERMSGMVRSVRLAVRADFGSYPVPDLAVLDGDEDLVASAGWDMVERELPRLEIERDLGDAVIRGCLARPEKAPQASWAADLVRAKKEEPDWEGVNKAF